MPSALQAQRALEFHVVPRGGVLTPADWFFEEFPHFGVGPLEWTESAVQQATVVGLAAELRLEALGIRLRGEVLRTVGGETSVTRALLHPVMGFDPPWVERSRYLVESSITWGSLALVLPTRVVLPGGIEPYFLGGVAAKRYGFDTSPLSDLSSVMVLPKDGVIPSIEVGIGLTGRLMGVGFDVLVRDSTNEYWDKRQHDVMVLGGLTFRMF